MRSFFLKIHRWIAIPLGIFFSILCFSGALLVFRHEIATYYGVPDHDMPFFRTVQNLHQWLFMSPASHDGTSVGKVLTGVVALCSVILLITGVILWWPKNKKMLKERLSVHFHKGWKRFVYDSHVSLGIYATLFLLLMALTGPTMSFNWYNKAASAIMGANAAPNAKPFGPQKQNGGSVAPFQDHSRGQMPAFKGGDGHGPEGFHGDHGHGQDMSGHMGIHGTIMNIHGGQWAGMVGEIVYFLAALIGGFLPISGYYLWWKRRKARSINRS